MSVKNLEGDGYADQPSVIYSYPDGDGNEQIRELARSGFGSPVPRVTRQTPRDDAREQTESDDGGGDRTHW